MSIKKILIGIIVLFAGLIAIGTIYLFNEEKFYFEYWFERLVDKSRDIGIRNHGEPKEVIKYKFYFDPSIDIAVELDDEGNMLIKRHGWFANNKNLNVHYFEIDKSEFKKLKKEFEARWTESVSKDADFKFGGMYYVIELADLDSKGQSISIAYYNVTPDKSFMDFKDKILDTAKSGLQK